MQQVQSANVERTAHRFENLHEARHVRAFDVVCQPDVHREFRDGVLNFAGRCAEGDRISEALDAHLLDRRGPHIRQGLSVG